MAVYLTDRMGGVPSTFAALARTMTAVHQVVIFLTIRQVRGSAGCGHLSLPGPPLPAQSCHECWTLPCVLPADSSSCPGQMCSDQGTIREAGTASACAAETLHATLQTDTEAAAQPALLSQLCI